VSGVGAFVEESGNPPDVLLTGLGVVSPLGCSVDEVTRRFAGGERVAEVGGGAPVTEVPLDVVPSDRRVRIGRLDRLCRFFLAASYLAMRDAGIQIEARDAERVGLSFGTGLGCLLTNEEYNRKIVEHGPAAASPRLFAYTVSSAAAGEVSIAAGIKGPNITAHMGLAAGLGAIGYGFDLIRLGKADVVLAGGADVIGAALLEGLRDMELLKGPGDTDPLRSHKPGLFPSEAAVVAVLERSDRVRERGVVPLGRIDGYAAGFEPTLTERQRDPLGIRLTVERAVRASGRSGTDVGLVLTSVHGTPLDDVEIAAISEGLGPGARPLLLHPKVSLGDCFGASGPLSLALGMGLLRDQPQLAAGVLRSRQGAPLSGVEAGAQIRECNVVMVNTLCYSGNCVTLVFSRA